MAQQDAVDVTVENVKDKAGSLITKTTKSITVIDTTLPEAQSVAVTGPTTIEVTFSEPIKTQGTFKLNNGTYYVAYASGVNTNKLTLNVGSLTEGTYTLNVAEAVDFANFKSVSKDLTFTYAKDTAAPTVSVDSISQTKAVLKFNEAITNSGSLSVYHTYNNVAAYAGTPVYNATDKTLTVTFTNPLPTGTVTLYVNNATTSPAADSWGNKFVSATLSATVTADTTAPTVTSVAQYDSANIDVTFSEEVTGANLASNYTLKDSLGNAITINSATKQGTTNTYRLNTSTLSGGVYTLSIAADAIKDTSYNQNKLAAFTTNVNITDKVAPTVTGGVFSTDKKKVQINFSEAMDASALTASNYQIAFNGTTRVALPTGTTIAWGADNKSVIMTFADAQATLVSGTSNVYVAQLADVAGNKTTAFENVVLLTSDNITSANIVADSVKAIADDTIQFQLNTNLSAIDVNKVSINGNFADSATYVNDGGKATVTVKTKSVAKFATDLSTLNATAVSVAQDGFTSAFGTKNSLAVDIAKATVLDYAAPAISSNETVDANANGKIDAVKVTFSEVLYVASIQEADFTVEGYTISGVSLDGTGKVATVTVKELSSVDSAATPKVTLVGEVSDNSAQRNKLGAQAAVTSSDKVVPIYTGANLSADKKTLTLSFSEAVVNNTLDATTLKAGITFAADGTTFVALAAGDTVAIVDGKLVITFASALSGTTNKVTIAANTLKDAAAVANVIPGQIVTGAISAN